MADRSTTALAVASPRANDGLTLATDHWWEQRAQLEVVRAQVAPGCSDVELAFFASVCKRTGLDPLAKQIHFVPRKVYDADAGQKVKRWAIQTSIDGFRLIANRTGKYRGQTPVEWCGKDGKWVDVWLSDTAPSAARVGIKHADFPDPLYAVAIYREYAQTYDGKATGQWKDRPALMLAKCAEALGFRKAFPQDLSGVYTDDEMGQEDAADAAAVDLLASTAQAFGEWFVAMPAPYKAWIGTRVDALGIDRGMRAVAHAFGDDATDQTRLEVAIREREAARGITPPPRPTTPADPVPTPAGPESEDDEAEAVDAEVVEQAPEAPAETKAPIKRRRPGDPPADTTDKIGDEAFGQAPGSEEA